MCDFWLKTKIEDCDRGMSSSTSDEEFESESEDDEESSHLVTWVSEEFFASVVAGSSGARLCRVSV